MNLAIFLLVALSVYTAVHAVVYWGMRPLLIGHAAVPALVWVWMAIMIVAPILVGTLERAGYERPAQGMAWVGFSWMGFVFLAFSMFLCIMAWELAVWVLSHLVSAIGRLGVYGPVSAAIVLLATVGTGLYGFHEASRLRVEKVVLPSERLGRGENGVRIIQVSDIHLGLMNREPTLAPLVSRIRELRPDVLVATGDVVDAQINHLDELSGLWAEIKPPLGKFAVLGNHENYAGVGQSIDFLRRSGFTVLRNEGRVPGRGIALVGVDDTSTPGPAADETDLLSPFRRKGLFTVLLKHRPQVDPGSAALFDLQLSGHAHRGQIFPFNLLTGISYPMQNGLYPLAGGGILYASRGTGTWGPPMRVLSPPEITVFDIHPR